MCHNGRNTDLGHNLDLLEKETATHSSNLAWEIPWTEEPGVTQSRTRLKRLSMHARHLSSFLSIRCQEACLR